MNDAFTALYDTITQRKADPQEGSYTCYLFEKGLDKILKKAAKNARKPSLPPKTRTMPNWCWKSAICYTI